MSLARQHEIQRVAQGVGDGVDLGAEPAARAAQRLGLGAALCRPGRARVGADDRGVDQDGLQIRQMRTAPVQCLPDAVAAPAGKALEDRVPLPMLGGQQTPRRPRPQDPQDGRQEGPASGLRRDANLLVGRHYRIDCSPFFVADFEPVRHRQKALTLPADERYVNRT